MKKTIDLRKYNHRWPLNLKEGGVNIKGALVSLGRCKYMMDGRTWLECEMLRQMKHLGMLRQV